MTKVDNNETLYYEKYRPQIIQDLLLPKEIKTKIQNSVSNKDIPNFGLWSDKPGTGKTSTAKAIIQEINGEALFINASLENGIDTLRGKIARFAASKSFDGITKIVVLDEADHFSKDGQAAFRGFIEEFSGNCRFIFTGNFKDKMISPLLDRLENYDFNEFSIEELAKPILDRLTFILDNEKTNYQKTDLIPVIKTYYPSIRSMVKTLQKFTVNGTLQIPENELDGLHSFDTIVNHIKAKKFNEMVKDVNSINAPSSFYSFMYNQIDNFKNQQKPQLVMTLAKYQEMDTNVRDKNLNMAACCTELMKIL